MNPQIVIPQWLSVSVDTRRKLREIFNIPATGRVEVVTDEFGKSKVMCDGCTHEDLATLTVDKMQEYLGSAAFDDTVFSLFDRIVDKIENPTCPAEGCISSQPDASGSEEKDPLQCPYCSYKAGNPKGLRMHQNIKHKDR